MAPRSWICRGLGWKREAGLNCGGTADWGAHQLRMRVPGPPHPPLTGYVFIKIDWVICVDGLVAIAFRQAEYVQLSDFRV